MRLILGAAAASLFAAGLLAQQWQQGHDLGSASKARREAPHFRLLDNEGKWRELRDFRGRAVILNFWATWCGPCRKEMPWLDELQRDFKQRGLTVLGVSADEQGWRVVTPFIAQQRITYPILVANASVKKQYGGLDVLPLTLFIDREGSIVAEQNAMVSREDLRRIADLLLSEPNF